jgi:hypothetical protein
MSGNGSLEARVRPGVLKQEHGIRYISMLKKIRTLGADQMYYFIDSHWTPGGQCTAANELGAYITGK